MKTLREYGQLYEQMLGREKPTANRCAVKKQGFFLAAGGDMPPYEKYGKVARELTAQEGKCAAQVCAEHLLRTVRDELGGLDGIAQVLRCYVLVNSEADFTALDEVADGFSDSLTQSLGARGLHARTVLGASTLEGARPSCATL
jgi:hypothetical protein